MNITPKPEDVVLCTFPGSLEGWLCAWVIRATFRTAQIPVQFETFGQRHEAPSPVAGRNWIIIGNRPVDHAAAKSVLSFEVGNGGSVPSPIPFLAWKRTFPYGVEGMVNGHAAIQADLRPLPIQVWDFFRGNPGRQPRLFDLIGQEPPHPALVCVETYDYGNFRTLDELIYAADDKDRFAIMETAGAAVLRDRLKRAGASVE